MNKFMKTFGLFLTVALFILASCGGGNSSSNNNIKDTTTIGEEIEKMVYPIPTPFEISQMLQKSGASYIIDLTNSTEHVDQYFTEKSKALNLGVYGADLSYTSTYNQAQDTRNFLACSKKLSDDLGISSMVNQNLIERAESNLENKDSLYKIVSESYYETFNYLNNNEKGTIAVMILAGGWVEGLYLSSQLALLSDDNSEIIKGIAHQKTTVSALLGLLDMHKENEDVKSVIENIKKISAIYDNVERNEQDEFKMTKEQFDELTKILDEVRTEFVKVS